ncbi:carcinoembryonic antigen-related cell adhesion molecule 20-like [Erpetoichthys calabaricus]|uniref:B-cell receptor CD22 n=1 Tax=Erpetoichthys calabaricus TaxID=27687 RepID=A0A8C4TDJ9_ERPCA|nr:carcinoembryonic antigen-related cell adhesion molecule 20-like [Erpetoichthys calabaricus]
MLLFIFLAVVSCAVDERAIYEPKTLCAPEGSTVRINCTYKDPIETTNVTELWFYGSDGNKTHPDGETTVYHTDKKKIANSHKERVEFLGNKNTTCGIKISNVSREESGVYRFRYEIWQPDYKWTQMPGVKVTITGLKIEATSMKVIENEAVTLECQMNCSLTDRVFWFRKGQHLKETSKKLEIPRASYEDHGSYWCQTGHVRSPSFLLNVSYAPRNVVITGHPTTSIEEGTSVTLNCTALAYPPGRYTWVKENSSQVGSGDQLHISKFNASHEGSYHCEATNNYGTTKSTAVNLTVNVNKNINVILYSVLSIITLSGLTLGILIFQRKKKTNRKDKQKIKGVEDSEDRTYMSLDRSAVASEYDTIMQRK